MASPLDFKNISVEFYIGTIRFNSYCKYSTIDNWKKERNWVGCFYSVSKPFPKHVPKNAFTFMLEMNNDTNKIMGVGLVQNYDNLKRNTGIFDYEYNRYNYNSSYRVERETLVSEKNKPHLTILEDLVFYGHSHYKRGKGIIMISPHRFYTIEKYNGIINFLKSLFPTINFETLNTKYHTKKSKPKMKKQ